MFGSLEWPMLGRALRSLAKQAEWISWLVFGVWLGRYLFAQDPIGLTAGLALFVLIQVGGVVCKLFADKCDECDEPTGGQQATEKTGEEASRTSDHDSPP